MTVRKLTPIDRILGHLEHALQTVYGTPQAHRPSPAESMPEATLTAAQQRHAAALLRVNHTGEVCAQALYDGQASMARNAQNRAYLQQAAAEETDHLAWCSARLEQLRGRPSRLNLIWYSGSYAIGAMTACLGDTWSLGFVVETERQVEAHLRDHIDRLPASDQRSRAVLEQMRHDEASHAEHALAHGGIKLPFPLPPLMQASSMVMKTIAYRI